MRIHVSPTTGQDTSNTGDATSPVATLGRAQQLARAALAKRQRVDVILHGGTYRLSSPLVFTSEDSGRPEAPCTYRAKEGETPVLCGSERLDVKWTRSSSFPAGVWEASVPGAAPFDQLWIDGRPMWMARFPNREQGEGLNVFDTWKLDHRVQKDASRDPLAPERIRTWSNPAGAYVHGMHPALWGGIHWRVTGMKPDGTLALEGGTQNNRGDAMHDVYHIIENVREELDQPGEWFHDISAGKLYVFPLPGTDLSRAVVEMSRVARLIEFHGTSAAPVRWVDLVGLTLQHTARTFMQAREPLLRSDWTIDRSGAIYVEGTEDCAVRDCTLTEVGGNGVFVSYYNRRFQLTGSHLHELGASGVCFVGSPKAVRNPLMHYDDRLPLDQIDRTPGPATDDYPADCLVEDCLIHRTGRVEKQTAGVHIAMAQSITVRHCSIYELPRSGINIGDGCWGGHDVDGCDIFDTVLETGDHGSFNSWGRDRFWENFETLDDDAAWEKYKDVPFLDALLPITLRNSRWRCDHGWDIDLDDGSTNYRISNNLCLHGGIKCREGFGRVVENNVLVDNGFHPHVWYKHAGDVFRHNVMAWARYAPARMRAAPWGVEMDYNLVHTPGVTDPKPATGLAEQSGGEAHSVLADARFVDVTNGNYQVREGSPALSLGFVNFDTGSYGVRKPALRAIACQPRLPALARHEPTSTKHSDESDWLGTRVKTITTIEEASAVGVALGEGGVMVLDAPVHSAVSHVGLRAGDLIVGVDGQPVRKTADLPPGNATIITVVRGQKRVKLLNE